jgi:hypothetical protein
MFGPQRHRSSHELLCRSSSAITHTSSFRTVSMLFNKRKFQVHHTSTTHPLQFIALFTVTKPLNTKLSELLKESFNEIYTDTILEKHAVFTIRKSYFYLKKEAESCSETTHPTRR